MKLSACVPIWVKDLQQEADDSAKHVHVCKWRCQLAEAAYTVAHGNIKSWRACRHDLSYDGGYES